MFGICNTKEELENLVKEKEVEKIMGQKTNPYGLSVGCIRDWDSKYVSEDGLSIYEDMIHHSMQDRKIHLTKMLGKKAYKKMVKLLSR